MPAEAVARVVTDGDAVEVVWADDGARTRVPFEPVGVTHTASQPAMWSREELSNRDAGTGRDSVPPR